MGEIYKLDGRITDIEIRMKNLENKLNEVLEKITTSETSNIKYGPKSFYRSDETKESTKRIIDSIP